MNLEESLSEKGRGRDNFNLVSSFEEETGSNLRVGEGLGGPRASAS